MHVVLSIILFFDQLQKLFFYILKPELRCWYGSTQNGKSLVEKNIFMYLHKIILYIYTTQRMLAILCILDQELRSQFASFPILDSSEIVVGTLSL